MLINHFLRVLQEVFISPFNLVLVTGFVLAEWLAPAQRIDRRMHLTLDVLGFAVALLCIPLIYGFLREVTEVAVVMNWAAILEGMQTLPSWGKFVLCALCIDFIGYWIHRGMHRYSWLWATHRWHHSIEQLYWFSGFRASFLQLLMLGIPQIVFPFLVFRMTLLEGAITMGIINFLQFWKHANLQVPWGPLEWLLVTPQYHAIHHHKEPVKHYNFGFMFTLWDRMFGTRLPSRQRPRSFAMGLTSLQKQSVWRMILGL